MAFDELHEKMKRIGIADGVDTSGRDEEEARKPFSTVGREEHEQRGIDGVIQKMLAQIEEDDRVTSTEMAQEILGKALELELQDDAFWNFNVYMVMDKFLIDAEDEAEEEGAGPEHEAEKMY